jgi:CHAT domain
MDDKQSLDGFLRQCWWRFRARLCLRMARGGVRLGLYREAVRYATQALAAYEDLERPRGQAAACALIAVASLGLGLPKDATAAGEKAIPLLDDEPAKKIQMSLLLGGAAHLEGSYLAAIQHFESAARLAEVRGSVGEVVAAFLGLGDCYSQLRHAERASKYAQLTIDLCRRHGDMRGLAAGLMLQAGACFLAADKEGTIRASEDALLIARRFGGPQLEAAARQQAAVLQGFLAGSLASTAELTHAVAPLGDDVPAHMNLPFAVHQARALAAAGGRDAAEQLLMDAAAKARASGSPKDLRTALLALAEIHRGAQRFAEVERVLREALDLDDRIRAMLGAEDDLKIHLARGFTPEHGLLMEALAAQDKPGEVMEAAEHGRARAFADLVASRLGTPQPVQRPISLAEMQGYVGVTGATIVEYSLIPRFGPLIVKSEITIELFISVMRPDHEVVSRRVTLGSLDLASEPASDLRAGEPATGPAQLRNVLTQSSTGIEDLAAIEDLEWLSEILIQPIADLLPRRREDTLLFVPDEVFLSVPFAALRGPGGAPLVDSHTLMIAPSVQVLEQIRTRKRLRTSSARSALVVGNPDGTLPDAEMEAREIARMLGVSALLGADASKDRVLREIHHHRVLHFATHGNMEDMGGNGVPGAIKLASAAAGAAWLRADEIMSLDLDADLVVLSACSTASGKETADGIVGLSRALLGAGAATVLAALWPVPDYNTRLLMVEFYREYLRTGDKAAALRQGMVAAMAENSNPRTWAAFTLIGERYGTPRRAAARFTTG